MFSGGFQRIQWFQFGGAEEENSTTQPQNVDNKSYMNYWEFNQVPRLIKLRKLSEKKQQDNIQNKGGDPEKFKKLTKAYEIQSNPEKKRSL